MSTKRTLDSVTLPSSKKQKVEVAVRSPFAISAMIKEIGKYFEGDHLKNYKLVCKDIERVMREEKPKPMEITLLNYERTTKTPGFHFIKVNDEPENVKLRETLKRHEMNKVTHLTVDYCEISADRFTRPGEFIAKFKLISLRIIRMVHDIVLYLNHPSYDSLSSLEIYSRGIITLSISRKLDNVKLCSYNTATHKPTVEIMVPEELVEYAKNIHCNAFLRAVFQMYENGDSVEVSRKVQADIVVN